MLIWKWSLVYIVTAHTPRISAHQSCHYIVQSHHIPGLSPNSNHLHRWTDTGHTENHMFLLWHRNRANCHLSFTTTVPVTVFIKLCQMTMSQYWELSLKSAPPLNFCCPVQAATSLYWFILRQLFYPLKPTVHSLLIPNTHEHREAFQELPKQSSRILNLHSPGDQKHIKQ